MAGPYPSEEEIQQSASGGGIGSNAAKGAALGGTLGSAIPGVGTAIGAGVGALAGGVAGFIQMRKAKKALAEINKTPAPEYSVSPEQAEAYKIAKQQSMYGYNPAQTAAFGQNIAQSTNTGYRQAVSMGGGNLAQAIRGSLGAQKLGAYNDFAASDAALQQQKMGALYGQTDKLTDQYNLIQSNRIQRRNMLEQAYGTAEQHGRQNMIANVQQMGAIAGQGYDAYQNQQQ